MSRDSSEYIFMGSQYIRICGFRMYIRRGIVFLLQTKIDARTAIWKNDEGSGVYFVENPVLSKRENRTSTVQYNQFTCGKTEGWIFYFAVVK